MNTHKQIYQSQAEIRPEMYSWDKDCIEKRFVLETLSGLPIDKLKELIGFEVVNPYDENVEPTLKEHLINDRVILLRAKIEL